MSVVVFTRKTQSAAWMAFRRPVSTFRFATFSILVVYGASERLSSIMLSRKRLSYILRRIRLSSILLSRIRLNYILSRIRLRSILLSRIQLRCSELSRIRLSSKYTQLYMSEVDHDQSYTTELQIYSTVYVWARSCAVLYDWVTSILSRIPLRSILLSRIRLSYKYTQP